MRRKTNKTWGLIYLGLCLPVVLLFGAMGWLQSQMLSILMCVICMLVLPLLSVFLYIKVQTKRNAPFLQKRDEILKEFEQNRDGEQAIKALAELLATSKSYETQCIAKLSIARVRHEMGNDQESLRILSEMEHLDKGLDEEINRLKMEIVGGMTPQELEQTVDAMEEDDNTPIVTLNEENEEEEELMAPKEIATEHQISEDQM